MLYSNILIEHKEAFGKLFETKFLSCTDHVGPIKGPQLEHNSTLIAQQPTGDDLCELLIFHKCTNLEGSYLSMTVSLVLAR